MNNFLSPSLSNNSRPLLMGFTPPPLLLLMQLILNPGPPIVGRWLFIRYLSHPPFGGKRGGGVSSELQAVWVLFKHHIPHKCDYPGLYSTFNTEVTSASLTCLASLFIPLSLSPPSWSELLGRGVGCLLFLGGIGVPARPPSFDQFVLYVYWAHTILREGPTTVLSSVPLPQKSYVKFL